MFLLSRNAIVPQKFSICNLFFTHYMVIFSNTYNDKLRDIDEILSSTMTFKIEQYDFGMSLEIFLGIQDTQNNRFFQL